MSSVIGMQIGKNGMDAGATGGRPEARRPQETKIYIMQTEKSSLIIFTNVYSSLMGVYEDNYHQVYGRGMKWAT